MKKLVSFASLCLMSIAMLSAQGVEEVTLVVSGDGVTKEEATHVALRSAIEQAYGCFVSANTEILNDSLVKDEIVTVTSGSISSYDELNVTELDSVLISVTLRARVSVNKLISYAKSKGSSCELSGALLTQEKRMLEMNIANTKKALNHLFTLVNEFVEKNDIWTYSLNITNVQVNGYVTGELTCKRNENGDNLENMIKNYLASISIDANQVKHLKAIGFYAREITYRGGFHLSTYYTYADFSCISQELQQSIQKNIDRRALVLFTDNLGFVYPTSHKIRSKGFNNDNTISLGLGLSLRWNCESRQSDFIWLQIPDQNMATLSNIEIVPFSDSRFENLVKSLYDQARGYFNQQLTNKKVKDYSTEDVYYWISNLELLYAIQNTLINYKQIKEIYSEEEIKKQIDYFTGWAATWRDISTYFADRASFYYVGWVETEVSKIAEQLTKGENLYRYLYRYDWDSDYDSDYGQEYFEHRSIIPE